MASTIARVDAEFFGQVRDAVEGFVALVDPNLRTSSHGRGVKVWFGDATREHYEAQLVRVEDRELLEIGFHAEYPEAAKNAEVLSRLTAQETTWRRKLGQEPAAGPFLGRRGWTRVSECWDPPKATLDTAIEVAARLADFVIAIEPRRRG